MRLGQRFGRNLPIFRLTVVCAASLMLANCNTVDSKYGVSASSRVVEAGKPVPKGGGVYRVGKPYSIAGKTYIPHENLNYSAEGMASWYGEDFHGRSTANGEVFDMNSISAAHTTLPLPSYVRVTNLRNQRSLIVRVNDRGPYAHNRVIDLSVQSAKLLGFYGHGLAPVRVEYVGRAPLAGSDDAKLVASLRQNGKPMPGQEPRPSREQKPVQIASSKPFVPELFDARPMTQARPAIATPVTQGEAAAADEDADRPATDKPKAAILSPAAWPAQARAPILAVAKPAPVETRLTSPVSAYAPVRYDSASGVMNGRGLY